MKVLQDAKGAPLHGAETLLSIEEPSVELVVRGNDLVANPAQQWPVLCDIVANFLKLLPEVSQCVHQQCKRAVIFSII